MCICYVGLGNITMGYEILLEEFHIQFELPTSHDFYSYNPQLLSDVIDMSKSSMFKVVTCRI